MDFESIYGDPAEIDPKLLMGMSASELARVVEMEPEFLNADRSEVDPQQLMGMSALELERVFEMDPEFLNADPIDHVQDDTVSTASCSLHRASSPSSESSRSSGYIDRVVTETLAFLDESCNQAVSLPD